MLHSDLHHENILSSERGWLAIDPKGVLGKREFEVTAFMRNPIKRAKKNLLTKEILLTRFNLISKELDLDKEPEEILFIDDIESNILPAKEAGFQTHHYKNNQELVNFLKSSA